LKIPEPPRLAERLARVAVGPSRYADEILADLREGFNDVARTASADAARRWYWKRALSLAVRFVPTHWHRMRSTVPRGDSRMMTLLADVRFAFRSLRRAPSFTLAAVLALGLGTGSAAAVFSLLRGVVLRPLPYAAPERLVMLWEVNHGKALEHEPISPVNFVDYRGVTSVFADAAAWWRPQINLVDDNGEPVRVNAIEVTDNLFPVLGVKPAIGSDFTHHPKLFGREREVIISDRLWHSRFGASPDVLGKIVHLNGFNSTIVGVMPAGFGYPGDTDLWQELGWDLSQHTRYAHFMESVARIKPGVSIERVNGELAALTKRLGAENAGSNKDWGARAVGLEREVAGVFRPALFALFGASGLLLLIACINVANLLLARALSRRREIALRAAIGASRPRLVRLFLTESAVLAGLGVVLGFVIAMISVKGLLAWTPIRIPRADDVNVDFAMLAFSALVCAITTVTFGLIPAVVVSRADLHDALKDGVRGSGSSGRKLRTGLVVAEVAFAVVLLSGAGLLIRSVRKLLEVNVGVNASSVVTIDLQLPDAAYADWARVDQFYTVVARSLREHPEVSAAGATNFLPLDPAWRGTYQAVDHPVAAAEAPETQYHITDDGYFQALDVPLIAGRFFSASDAANAPPVIVINETMARQVWPGQSAIGKRIVSTITGFGPLSRRLVPGNDYQVIGVVRDIKNTSLRTGAEPAVYFSEHQFPSRKMYMIVRGRADPSRLVAITRDAVKGIDPSVALGDVKTMDRVLAASVDPSKFVMLLLMAFASLALVLAGVGIYGILTFIVNHRRGEIGIRLALGAEPAAMLRMVARDGFKLALLGSAIGVLGALISARLLTQFLFGIEPWDPATLAAVVLAVMAVATAACLIPGRRAAAEDPARALRAN
jgi:predicted permease